MNFTGGKAVAKVINFGETYVVDPVRAHRATVVWLHGLGDEGSSWSQHFGKLPHHDIKFICPTAPIRPVQLNHNLPTRAWFNLKSLLEDDSSLLELDTSAEYVAKLLFHEPNGVKIYIGGFSMGAAVALYSASCFALGKYSNRQEYPVSLSGVIGLSGWFPCSKILGTKLRESGDSALAASLPILLCHGEDDQKVEFKNGESSYHLLKSVGFKKVVFKAYPVLGHSVSEEELDFVFKWIAQQLDSQGSSS